jgi:hypothetical protein
MVSERVGKGHVPESLLVVDSFCLAPGEGGGLFLGLSCA